MLEMFQKLQLSVRSLGEHRRAERLHDLLDRHRLSRKLIFCRAASPLGGEIASRPFRHLPDKPEGSHAHRLQIGVSKGISVHLVPSVAALFLAAASAHLEVISNVVPVDGRRY